MKIKFSLFAICSRNQVSLLKPTLWALYNQSRECDDYAEVTKTQLVNQSGEVGSQLAHYKIWFINIFTLKL